MREFFFKLTSHLQTDVAAQNRNLYLWLPVLFGAGIAAYFGLPFEPPFYLNVFALIFAGMLLFDARKTAGGKIAALMLMMFAAGFTLAQIRTADVGRPILKYRTKTVETRGIVESIRFRENNRVGVVLKNVSVDGIEKRETPAKARLSLKDAGNIRTGDEIQAAALLSPPAMPAYPDASDRLKADYFAQIGARGYARRPPKILKTAADKITRTDALRTAVRARLDAASAHAGLSAALLLGETRDVPEKITQDYRFSGIAHLLSVSGVHMGLATGTVFAVIAGVLALFPCLALRFNVRKIAAVIAVAGGAFYLMLSGAPVSAQRAFVMAAFVFCAIVANRRAISLTSLAWAAFFILVLFPESLLAVGFQLSFCAVLGLICLFDFFGRDAPCARTFVQKAKRRFFGLIAADAAAVAATLPLSLYYFNYMPLYGMFGNLIAGPVAGVLVMPFLFLSLALMPFHLEKYALKVSDFGLSLINESAAYIASLPHAVLRFPALPTGGVLLSLCGMLIFCLWKTRTRYAGAVIYVCGLCAVMTVEKPDFLLDSDGSAYAVRDDAGKLRTSAKGNPFVKSVWLVKNGQNETETQTVSDVLPYEGKTARFFCKNKLCVYQKNKQKIAVARTKKAAQTACRDSSVAVLVAVTAKKMPCAGKKTIQRTDLLKHGTYAFYVSPDNVIVRRSGDSLGHRPWIPSYGRAGLFDEIKAVYNARENPKIKARTVFSPLP